MWVQMRRRRALARLAWIGHCAHFWRELGLSWARGKLLRGFGGLHSAVSYDNFALTGYLVVFLSAARLLTNFYRTVRTSEAKFLRNVKKRSLMSGPLLLSL